MKKSKKKIGEKSWIATAGECRVAKKGSSFRFLARCSKVSSWIQNEGNPRPRSSFVDERGRGDMHRKKNLPLGAAIKKENENG